MYGKKKGVTAMWTVIGILSLLLLPYSHHAYTSSPLPVSVQSFLLSPQALLENSPTDSTQMRNSLLRAIYEDAGEENMAFGDIYFAHLFATPVLSRELDTYRDNWNHHIRVFVSPLFSNLVDKESSTPYANFLKFTKLISQIYSVFKEKDPSLREICIDTDISFLRLSRKERIIFIEHLKSMLVKIPDVTTTEQVKQELEKNNGTCVFGIPVHRGLDSNVLFIDLQQFFPLCPLCGCPNPAQIKVHKTYGTTSFNIVQCSHCKLISNSPQPTDRELARYYEMPYYQKTPAMTAEKREGYSRYLDESTSRIAGFKKNFLALINQFAERRGVLIDVGSAGGYLLEAAQQDGWDVIGIEPAEGIVLRSQEQFGFGHRVHTMTLEQAVDTNVISSGSVDAVTFYNTLEHMKSPKEVLEKANVILKEKGLIALWLPNVDSVAHDRQGDHFYHFEYGHIFSFSLDTLTQLLAQCGFEVIFSKTPAPFGDFTPEERQIAEFSKRGEYMLVIARKVYDTEQLRGQRMNMFNRLIGNMQLSHISEVDLVAELKKCIPAWEDFWAHMKGLRQEIGGETIAEHTLQTLKNIAELSAVMPVHSVDLERLIRIMILHDIGKGLEPHELVSVYYARALLKFMGVSQQQLRKDLLLIEQHGTIGRLTQGSDIVKITQENIIDVIKALETEDEIYMLGAINLIDIMNRNAPFSNPKSYALVIKIAEYMAAALKDEVPFLKFLSGLRPASSYPPATKDIVSKERNAHVFIQKDA